MANLCTVEDVVNEGHLTESQADLLSDSIEWKIEDLSEYLNSKKREDATEYDLKMCCVYGVLLWLENNTLIQSTQPVISKTEGDISVTYANPSAQKTYSHSYLDKYSEFYALITPRMPVGRNVGYGYGDYL